jgi:hypothetical protein
MKNHTIALMILTLSTVHLLLNCASSKSTEASISDYHNRVHNGSLSNNLVLKLAQSEVAPLPSITRKKEPKLPSIPTSEKPPGISPSIPPNISTPPVVKPTKPPIIDPPPVLVQLSNSSLILEKNKWWKNTNSSDRLKGISFEKKDNEYVVLLHDQSGAITVYIYELILDPYPKNNIIPIDLKPFDSRKLVYHSILQVDRPEKPEKLKIVLRRQPLNKKRPEIFTSEQEVNFEVSLRNDI